MYLKWTRNFIIRLCLLVYSSSSKRGRDWAAVFHHHHHYGRHSWARARTRSRERWSSSNGVVAAAILPWQFQLFFFNSLSFVFYVSSPSSQSPFCVVLFQWLPKELPDFIITPRKMKMTLPFKNASSYSTHIDIFSIKWQFINSTAVIDINKFHFSIRNQSWMNRSTTISFASSIEQSLAISCLMAFESYLLARETLCD